MAAHCDPCGLSGEQEQSFKEERPGNRLGPDNDLGNAAADERSEGGAGDVASDGDQRMKRVAVRQKDGNAEQHGVARHVGDEGVSDAEIAPPVAAARISRRMTRSLSFTVGLDAERRLAFTLRFTLYGSTEAGAAYRAAEVFTAHFDGDTHFCEAGAHAFADAVAEGFFAVSAARGGAAAVGAGGEVGVVGGDDGGAFVVVAGVEDEGDRVPDPVGGFSGAEFVEDEDLGVEDGLEDFHLRGRNLRVVGVLDFLQELAVVAKEAVDPFFDDEGVEDADGEVGFTDADGPGEQEAAAAGGDWIAVDETARHQVRRGQRAVGSGKAGFVAIEGAVLVAGGNGGAVEEPGDALFQLAGAALDNAASSRDRCHPHA